MAKPRKTAAVPRPQTSIPVLALGMVALLFVLGFLIPRPKSRKAELTSWEMEARRRPNDPKVRIGFATAARAANQPFLALQQLEVARALGDGDPRTPMTAARLYDELGEAGAAEETLRDVVTPEAAAERSRLLLDQGFFGEAAKALAKAPAPSDPLSRRRLTRTLLLAGRVGRAAHIFPRDPVDDPDWLALRGWQRILAGKPSEAVGDLKRALASAPKDGWNGYLLGQAYESAGDSSKAIYTWMAASRMPSAPPRAAINAARLMVREGLWKNADAALARVETESKEDPLFWEVRAQVSGHLYHPLQAVLDRGRSLFHSGDPWAAESLYRRSIRQYASSPNVQDVWAALVRSAEERNDSRAALTYASDACAKWPKEPFFLRRRAELLLEENSYAEAREMSNRLEAVSAPSDPEVADLKCRLALESGDPAFEAAATAYAASAPQEPSPLLLLGEWRHERGPQGGGPENELEAYREAVRRAPNNPEAHARLGGLLAELRRKDDAIRELLQALSLSPRVMDGVPDIQLARMYRLTGRKPEAEFHERRYAALRRSKDDWLNLLRVMRGTGTAADWRRLGDAALERKESWIGLCAFVRLTRLTPLEPSAWRGLAAAQRRLGRFEEALSAMLRAEKLRPSGTGA
jgi:tetratricopeptide (TPR) repeat protein